MGTGKGIMEMNEGDFGLMLNICLALKPLAEIADEFDNQNTYRPDRPAEDILYQLGEKSITLQHCFNAQRIFKELTS